MTKVLDFLRARITRDDRQYRPGECTHRHIKLESHGGIVSCVECKSALSPFWALTMLSHQYEMALANIARLNERVALADGRIGALSRALDDANKFP
jgi:hypothetical protein